MPRFHPRMRPAPPPSALPVAFAAMGASSGQWERFAREDAYFGVVSQDQFRHENLDEEARERFFATGSTYVDWVLGRIRRHAGADYQPRTVLDYGCGVGRVLMPLAEQAERAVGVDVSPSMLAEARRNADARELTEQVDLIEPSGMAALAPEFDLVHTALVLQHIPVRDGEAIRDTLLSLVAPGGIAVLQIPFVVSHWTGSAFSRLMRVPFAHNLVNLAGRRPWSYPYMEMNVYRTDRLLAAVLDQEMTVLDLVMERGGGNARWRYDSCWLFARRPAEGEAPEPDPQGG
jgi:2-polyprenyl-3-methyl-5-hydroxy-6-metoxy-1,4-benzoquinol methylase